MEIDLRGTWKGNSSIVINSIVSENSKEYWCYPILGIGEYTMKLGTLYVDKDSMYGIGIKALLDIKASTQTINNYCVDVVIKHLNATGLHEIVNRVATYAESRGKQHVRDEIRRVIMGY